MANAGSHGADWWTTLMAVNETLSKCVGHGSTLDRLRSDRCYETARRAIYLAWRRGEAEAAGVEVQGEMFDVSEAYR